MGQSGISFHDLLNLAESELEQSEGYQKIRSCCALGAAEGHEYVWIDTYCIDKTSSAELTEAINSMYRWYQGAQICYAYLADVHNDHQLWDTTAEEAFSKSRWFTRGWTLQELLAPKNVVFYEQNWRKLGSKSNLIAQISLATGIQQDHIHNINGASVAQKMSWASKRQTRRVEDVAYSLMGIFDVNMPLLYGEGKKAFTRLQHEIVKISNDESLFAWTDDGLVESGLFAQSPKAFAEAADVVRIGSESGEYIYRAPYTVTNRGLAIESFVSSPNRPMSILDRRFIFLPLNCIHGRASASNLRRQLAIGLERVSQDEFVRFSPGQLDYPQHYADRRNVALLYIRPGFMSSVAHKTRLSLFIDSSSLSTRNLFIQGSYNCRPERQWCAQSNETLERITLGSGERFAAILLEGFHQSRQRSFVIMMRAAQSNLDISLIALDSAQDFLEVMDKHSCSRDNHFSAHPAPIRLHNNRWVSMALTENQVGLGQTHYLAEFVPTSKDDIHTQGIRILLELMMTP